jgi:hypothetical protein
MAAAPKSLLDNRDDDPDEPAILRATALLMGSSAGIGDGADP